MKNLNKRTLFVAVVALAPIGGSFAGVVAIRQLSVASPKAKIGPVQAIHAALGKVHGVPFSATFEYDGGKWGYDVIVIHNHKASEVEVNAMTGKVGDVEAAIPADEASELKSDLTAAIKKW